VRGSSTTARGSKLQHAEASCSTRKQAAARGSKLQHAAASCSVAAVRGSSAVARGSKLQHAEASCSRYLVGEVIASHSARTQDVVVSGGGNFVVLNFIFHGGASLGTFLGQPPTSFLVVLHRPENQQRTLFPLCGRGPMHGRAYIS
jgi:hypothetical protein